MGNVSDRDLDADGNVLTSEYDWDGDGVADEMYAYTYDADGSLID